MSQAQELTTFTEAAVKFGVSIQAISAIVVAKGIQTKSVPRCGNAKGLDGDDMAELEEALKPGRTAKLAASHS